MLLNREQILAAPDIKTLDVEVPEWSSDEGPVASVRLRAMDVETAKVFQRARQDAHDVEIFSLLVAFSLIDEGGKPLFTPEQAKELNAKNPVVLTRLGNAALTLNGMGEADEAEAIKNS